MQLDPQASCPSFGSAVDGRSTFAPTWLSIRLSLVWLEQQHALELDILKG